MVQRRPVRDVAAAIVTDHGEAVVAEVCHEAHDVAGHGSVAVRMVAGVRVGADGPAVAAQVGADGGQPGLDQLRGDLVPGGVRAGMTVEEDHSRAGAAVTHADRHVVIEPFVLEREALEDRHLPIQPPDPSAPRALIGDLLARSDLRLSVRLDQ